jgi:mannose-6-phosphate isomerase-like protein (cupin superfamily)
MKQAPIDLLEKFELFDTHWSPRVIAELNDYQFKLARFEGHFVWHSHDDTDEVFIVVEGEMGIEFRDRTVRISQGQMIVVPRGVEHRPFADAECKVMLVEPRGVVNTGRAGGDHTAPNDVWI